MGDQDIILNNSHSEAEAGVKEEDQHEDVVEYSVAIIVRTAQITSGGLIFHIQYPRARWSTSGANMQHMEGSPTHEKPCNGPLLHVYPCNPEMHHSFPPLTPQGGLADRISLQQSNHVT